MDTIDRTTNEPNITDEQNWAEARPTKLIPPTYWPFFLAVGLVFILWGLLTIWLISLAGLVVFIIALVGWINNIRHEEQDKGN